jgi:hypothetical protein
MEENKDIRKPKETQLPWNLLDEEIREDNRSVVEHNFIKLRTIGLLTSPEHCDDPYRDDVDFSFLKDDKLVEQLAEMEHRRWMANKFYYAWDLNPVRKDSKKRHNSLIDYEELDNGTKDYDIQQIMELPEVWEVGKRSGNDILTIECK